MVTLEELDIPYVFAYPVEPVILEVLKTIENAGSKPAQGNWDSYWGTFSDTTHPSYLQRDRIFRYKGRYISAPSTAELQYFIALKQKCFKRYFRDGQTIAEFGCGSGSNLAQLASLFPQAILHAYDWSKSAVMLASKYAKAEVFDMVRPSPVVLTNSNQLGVFTSGAMEQLGDNFEAFFQFLKSLKASIYLHIEPLIELYDESNLFDYLAMMYHRKRGYLGKYLTRLRDEVRIIDCVRTGFGSYHNEGYMVVAWSLT